MDDAAATLLNNSPTQIPKERRELVAATFYSTRFWYQFQLNKLAAEKMCSTDCSGIPDIITVQSADVSLSYESNLKVNLKMPKGSDIQAMIAGRRPVATALRVLHQNMIVNPSISAQQVRNLAFSLCVNINVNEKVTHLLPTALRVLHQSNTFMLTFHWKDSPCWTPKKK